MSKVNLLDEKLSCQVCPSYGRGAQQNEKTTQLRCHASIIDESSIIEPDHDINTLFLRE
jgi:hypothetical protein